MASQVSLTSIRATLSSSNHLAIQLAGTELSRIAKGDAPWSPIGAKQESETV
jgi:hypothetical protein